jgi:hypothetical protein
MALNLLRVTDNACLHVSQTLPHPRYAVPDPNSIRPSIYGLFEVFSVLCEGEASHRQTTA